MCIPVPQSRRVVPDWVEKSGPVETTCPGRKRKQRPTAPKQQDKMDGSTGGVGGVVGAISIRVIPFLKFAIP